MTFIGRILVILITALSLVFLGVATVALTTATDWKAELKKENDQLKDLRERLRLAKESEDQVGKKFEEARKDHAGALTSYEASVQAISSDTKKAQDEINTLRASLAQTQTGTRETLEQVQARTGDITTLRQQVAAVGDQAGKFKAHQGLLNDEIVSVRRFVDRAERNSAQIRQSH